MTRFLSLLLSFLLGFFFCIGAIAGVGYYAYSRVSYDKLKDWGVVKADESSYLKEDAEVDLSAMTVKAFLAELKDLQNLEQDVTLDLLIDRWGLNIPEDVQLLIPSGVLTVPVKDIFSQDGIDKILEQTKIRYLFQILKQAAGFEFSEAADATLGEKPLKDLQKGDYAALLDGVKLGYLVTSVKYEKQGDEFVLVYGDAENPTTVELLSGIDLGKMLAAMNGGEGNSDSVLSVVRDGMKDVSLDDFLRSLSAGDEATVSGIVKGRTVADLIVLDEATGEYTFEMEALIKGRKIGDLLGYKPVYLGGENDERKIIIDWVDEDGKRLTGELRAIADGTINGLSGADFDLDQLLWNAYIGFFQEFVPLYEFDEAGQIRISGWKLAKGFDPVYDADGKLIRWIDGEGNLVGADAEGNPVSASNPNGYTPVKDGNGIIVGWKDGEGNDLDRWEGDPPDRVQSTLANKKITDLLSSDGDGFDMNDLIAGLYVGDLMGYKPVENAAGEIVGWRDGDGAKLSRLNEALAKQPVDKLTGGKFNYSEILEGLYVGDLLPYASVKNPPDGTTGWKDGGDEENEPVYDDESNLIGWNDKKGNVIGKAADGSAVTEADPKGYTPVKDGNGIIVGWKDGEGNDLDRWEGDDLDRVTEAIAKQPLKDLHDDGFDSAKVLKGLYVGDMLKYTPIKDDPLNPEKITGWKDGVKDVVGVDRATANIDLGRLLDEEDDYQVSTAFNEVYMGEAMNYHRGEMLPKDDPTDENEAVRYQWYKTKDAVTGDLSNPTQGIEQKLSNYFLGDLINGKVKSADITEGMPLHELLELHAVDTPLYDADGNPLFYTTGEHVGDQATVKIWYDKDNVRQSNTISALAYCTIDGISEQVDGVKVGGVTGLTLFEGNWYKAEFKTEDFDGDAGTPDETRYCLSPATGVLPSLADLTIGNLSDNALVTEKIKTVTIGDAMGYSFSGGVWYTDNTQVTPVSGMMKALAPKTVGEMETIGDDMPIGELLGYEKVGGVWYETYVGLGDPGNVKASGIMAAIADFHINGLGNNVKTIKIGSILELYRYESDDPLDPNYGTWYKDEARTIPADGIMAKFAELTVEEMKDSDKVTQKTKTILIADAMGYTYHDGKWYSTWIAPGDPGNVKASNLMQALAPKTVGQMDGITKEGDDGIPVGTLLGYEKHEGIWYEIYDESDPLNNKEASGVIGAICDTYLDNLSGEIEGMKLGKALSLYQNPIDSKWYKDRTFTQPATGVMVEFADLTINDLSDETAVSSKSVNVQIGYAMGYTYYGGVWYTDAEHTFPVTGVMKALAPKRVGELSNLTHTMTVGEMMGYEKVGGVWYSTYIGPDDSGNVKASGVIQAVADSYIDSLETDLNNTKVGKILGYTYNEVEHWWYDGLTKTSTIINTVSDTELNQIGTRMSNLTVADMFSETERQSGFLSFLPANARLDELGGTGPNSMTEIFKNTKMGNYVAKGLITFSPATEEKLDTTFGSDPETGWRGKTIQQFLDSIMYFVP